MNHNEARMSAYVFKIPIYHQDITKSYCITIYSIILTN